jgi:Carboxypeptidase regulatory-like domain
MRTLRAALGLLLLLSVLATEAGCRWPWEPRSGPIVGSVRYPDGSPVWGARVIVVGGDTTFTGETGRFWLPVPAGAETVTVSAHDGWQPNTAWTATRYGSVRLVVRPEVLITRIVLDHSTPI